MPSKWPPVPLPRREVGEHPKHLAAQVDTWLQSEPLHALVSEFGGDAGDRHGADLADFLDHFAADTWDFRGGRERNLAREADLSKDREALAVEAADSLGLVGTRRPSREHYDAVLILGGLVRACVVRPRYVADLLRNGLRTDEVVALGGFREIAGDEVALSRRLGISGDNEFEAMTQGVEMAFDRQPHWTVDGDLNGAMNGRWMVRTAEDEAPTLQVIAAPSSEPGTRRANTIDTYRFYAERSAVAHKHLLIVTNPAYVPYQGCGATQVLGLQYDWSVETVGADAASSDLGDDTQLFGPQQYLQEIRSAIHGMKSLREAALNA